MDCEKFDDDLMDALYGELDELAAASLRRHVDSCARCRSVWDSFESTRRAAVLPLEAPSARLTERILAAEQAELRHAPVHRKLLRAVAWAGSHAMRPQLAMAALFMLVVGSSLLLLRSKPGTLGVPIEVTELGRPTEDAAAKSEVTLEQAPGAAPLRAEGDESASRAKSGRASAERGLDLEPSTADEPRPSAAAPSEDAKLGPGGGADGRDDADQSGARRRQALDDALALKAQSGCAAALGALRAIETTHPGTDESRVALREAAACEAGAISGAAGAAAAGPSRPTSTASAPAAPSATTP